MLRRTNVFFNNYRALDLDAQNVIEAIQNTGITLSTTQVNSINDLISECKSYQIWTKNKVFYGFIGGSPSAHKFNWKDPRDLDAAFRLQFYGGGVHSLTGYQGNTNVYAKTFLNAFNHLSNSNLHLSFYSRTANTTNAYSNEIQVDSAYTPANYITFRTNNKNGGGGVWFSAGNDGVAASASLQQSGFYVGSETSSNLRKMYRNGVIIATNNTEDINSLPNANLNILGSQIANSYSFNEVAFVSMGEGLSDVEVSNFYTSIQSFQTKNNRQV